MVIRTLEDGSYEWGCEDCGRRHLEQAHRGPRKSVCKACQKKRYRKSGGEGLRERNRERMPLRHRDSDPVPAESTQPASGP